MAFGIDYTWCVVTMAILTGIYVLIGGYIASAEIYLREGLADSVLIVCPTSLKYQWKREIERFTGGDTLECEGKYMEEGRVSPKVIVIEGNPTKREQLYNARALSHPAEVSGRFEPPHHRVRAV